MQEVAAPAARSAGGPHGAIAGPRISRAGPRGAVSGAARPWSTPTKSSTPRRAPASAAMEGQTRLFHGGEQLLANEAMLPPAGGEGYLMKAGGRLSLGRNMPPGEDALQIIVTDRLGPGDKFNRAVQTLDFEIEP